MKFLGARWRKIVLVTALVLASWPLAVAQERRRDFYAPAPLESIHAVPAEFGMVVAQEKLGAQIGADILRQGGNAVDAAGATGFAMAATYPRAAKIAGGWGLG